MTISILHFSDIHNNKKALEKVISLANEYKDFSIAITGDVCSITSPFPAELYDTLPNPHTWLVRGNHDYDPKDEFFLLKKVTWQTPYFSKASEYVGILGLDSEGLEVSTQLALLRPNSGFANTCTIVVLHHRPYLQDTRESILEWIRRRFPKAVTVILLHGHEHFQPDFYSRIERDVDKGLTVFTSHVYSANYGFQQRHVFGCANLFTIEDNGDVPRWKVALPGDHYIQKPRPFEGPRPKTSGGSSSSSPKGMCRLCCWNMTYNEFKVHIKTFPHNHKLTEQEKNNPDVFWEEYFPFGIRPVKTIARTTGIATTAKPATNRHVKSQPGTTKPPLIGLIKKAMKKCKQDGDGWVYLYELGTGLLSIDPNFKYSDYGFNKLSKLINSLDQQIEQRVNEQGHTLVRFYN